jgi:hypothetical protein
MDDVDSRIMQLTGNEVRIAIIREERVVKSIAVWGERKCQEGGRAGTGASVIWGWFDKVPRPFDDLVD